MTFLLKFVGLCLAVVLALPLVLLLSIVFWI